MKRKIIPVLLCLLLSGLPVLAQNGGTVLTVTVPEQPEETIQAPAGAKTVGEVPLPEGWEWADGSVPITPGVDTTAYAVYRDSEGGELARREIVITQEAPEPEETETAAPEETEMPDPDKMEYPAVSVDNADWVGSTDEGISVTIPEEAGAVKKVIVDGNELDESDYTISTPEAGDDTAADGGQTVMLTPEYLATLEEGEHTIRIQGENGYVEVEFTVEQAETETETEPESEAETETEATTETEAATETETETPDPEKTEYPAVSVDNPDWAGSTDEGISVTIPEEAGAIVKVIVDGKELDESDYTISTPEAGDDTAADGSQTVTLTPEYLETLEDGEHTVRIQGENGYVEVEFTVEQADPETETEPESEAETETEATTETEAATETEMPEPEETETPDPEKTEYPAVSVDNADWAGSTDEGISVTIPEEAGAVIKVIVDGNELKESDYTITTPEPGDANTAGIGQTVTLKPEYLETLEDGEHTVRIQGENGYVEVEFTVEQAEPETETEPESEAETETEATTETETEATTETETEIETVTETETETKPAAETESETAAETESETETPKTGDSTPITENLCLMLMAAAILLGIGASKKRKAK